MNRAHTIEDETIIEVPLCICKNNTRGHVKLGELDIENNVSSILYDHKDHYQKIYVIGEKRLLYQLIIPKREIEDEFIRIWQDQEYVMLEPYEKARFESKIYDVLSDILEVMDGKKERVREIVMEEMPWKLVSELMDIHDYIWEDHSDNIVKMYIIIKNAIFMSDTMMGLQELIRRGVIDYNVKEDFIKIRREGVIKDTEGEDDMGEWFHMARRNINLWD